MELMKKPVQIVVSEDSVLLAGDVQEQHESDVLVFLTQHQETLHSKRVKFDLSGVHHVNACVLRTLSAFWMKSHKDFDVFLILPSTSNGNTH